VQARLRANPPLSLALFCDYYNADSQCTWHYKPCGSPCMRTCQNPSGHCLRDLGGLEGELRAGLRGAGLAWVPGIWAGYIRILGLRSSSPEEVDSF
jgi:hypothetical protein